MASTRSAEFSGDLSAPGLARHFAVEAIGDLADPDAVEADPLDADALDALASGWGVEPVDGHGKRVWATLSVVR